MCVGGGGYASILLFKFYSYSWTVVCWTNEISRNALLWHFGFHSPEHATGGSEGFQSLRLKYCLRCPETFELFVPEIPIFTEQWLLWVSQIYSGLGWGHLYFFCFCFIIFTPSSISTRSSRRSQTWCMTTVAMSSKLLAMRWSVSSNRQITAITLPVRACILRSFQKENLGFSIFHWIHPAQYFSEP